MREIPLQDNPQAFEFAARLLGAETSRTGTKGGNFDMAIFLTGVGARLLNQIVETRYPPGSFAEALRHLAVVVRGSKPAAVMREWNVPIAVTVPEPNTWREVLAATESRTERRIAVQEYGRPTPELIDGLRARGAEVTTVPVYQWDLPADLGPLRDGVHRLAAAEFDVLLLTTSVQVLHLFRVASEENLESQVRAALPKMVIASVGPSTSSALREFGFEADLEPSHPKMGFLVSETAARAHEILVAKSAR